MAGNQPLQRFRRDRIEGSEPADRTTGIEEWNRQRNDVAGDDRASARIPYPHVRPGHGVVGDVQLEVTAVHGEQQCRDDHNVRNQRHAPADGDPDTLLIAERLQALRFRSRLAAVEVAMIQHT
ncbi:MAG TPA: hypothetical protein VMM79_06790 [Longimicrobiales bacterium]|nr:hypothetical protein [Longimicrobiales bacterium]